MSEPLEFDDLIDLLRQRLFDAEAIKPGEMHSFRTLLEDHADWIPEGWYDQLYDELDAQGHMDPRADGRGFGSVAGRLSADGLAYVRAQGA